MRRDAFSRNFLIPRCVDGYELQGGPVKKGMLFVGLTLALIVALGCEIVTGWGPLLTKGGDMGEFDSLDVSHAFNVRITRSDRCRVEVKTNENLMRYLVLENRGKVLHIGFQPDVLVQNATSEAYVEMPYVREIHFSGASDGRHESGREAVLAACRRVIAEPEPASM